MSSKPRAVGRTFTPNSTTAPKGTERNIVADIQDRWYIAPSMAPASARNRKALTIIVLGIVGTLAFFGMGIGFLGIRVKTWLNEPTIIVAPPKAAQQPDRPGALGDPWQGRTLGAR